MNAGRIVRVVPFVVLLLLGSAALLHQPRQISTSRAVHAPATEGPQPADPHSMWERGEHFWNARKHEEALATFQRITREHATTQLAQPAQFRIAQCLSALQRVDEAIAAYNKVQDFPHSDWYGADWAGGARLEPGRLLKSQGRVEEAIAAYRKAADRESQQRGWALRELAQLCRNQHRYQEALQAYLDLAHTASSWAPEALWGMAQIHEEAGQTDKFFEQSQKLARLYPNSLLAAQALLKEAAVYRAQGKGERALSSYNRVATAFTGMREGEKALWESRRLFEASGKRLAAADAYRSLLRSYYPESVTARDAAERLAAMGLSLPTYAGRDRRILIDETHGEARTGDVAHDGSGVWYGQRELLTGLIDAGYVVHVIRAQDAPYPPPAHLAQANLSRYAAVIINGGHSEGSFSPDEVQSLTESVRQGGALLVTSGRLPESLNHLLAPFGIGFGPAKPGRESSRAIPVLAADQAALPFLPKEVYVAQETQVTGIPDIVLVHLDGAPLIAAVKHGRGIVVAVAVGHAFMGTGLSPIYCKEHAANLRFLLDLVAWMIQEVKP